MVESSGAPGSQASLREANSVRVVEAVRLYGKITQVELASVTGLSPATVSNIVRRLQGDGVVATEATIRSGRRAQLVTLARTTALAAGIHIGARALEIRLVDSGLADVARQHLPLPVEHRDDTTLDRAAMLVTELADGLGADPDALAGIGVALPLSATGAGPGLPGWSGVDVAEALGRRFAPPVTVIGATEAAAVAESRAGALRGAACGLYVSAGDTTESCLILGGTVHRGAGLPVAGIGHVRVAPSGAICRCGARGCLNTVVSAEALGDLLRISHGRMQPKDIVAAANTGDRGCQQVIADAGAVIGGAIADVATMLAPDRIAVGGLLAGAGEVFLGPIRDALRTRPLLGADTLVAGALGASASAIGVAALVLESAGSTPLLEG